MPIVPTPHRFWLFVAATLLAGVLAYAVIVNSTGTPWGSPAGLILDLPPDWRIWLVIGALAALVAPLVKSQLVGESSAHADQELAAIRCPPRSLQASLFRYLYALRSVSAGAVVGIVVWDFPVLCLFVSGLVRAPGISLLFSWALIIGAGLGAVCGVISIPWIGGLVGALVLARIFLSRAAPWEVPLVLAVLVTGAMFGYFSSSLSLTFRRRLKVFGW